MKLVCIGDIHGLDLWKQIVNQEQDADQFIFVGDYFDSFHVPGLVQMQNFQDIIEFKKQSKVPVTLLIGNHDYHYFPEVDDTSTSGYQTRLAPSIKHLINTNREHLQMACSVGKFLFTHAGVSSEWLDDTIEDWSIDTIAKDINELFKYKPLALGYRSYRSVGDQITMSHGYGDETYQGPLWIRPRSLKKANYDTLRREVIQVVGHTPQPQIDIKGASTGGRYYFIDALEHGPREYLIIENNKVKLGTWQKQS
jgi:hypothetical protein